MSHQGRVGGMAMASSRAVTTALKSAMAGRAGRPRSRITAASAPTATAVARAMWMSRPQPKNQVMARAPGIRARMTWSMTRSTRLTRAL